MSKVESSSLASSSLPATPSTVLKPINTDVLAPPSTSGDISRSGSVSAVQTPVAPSAVESGLNRTVPGPNIGLDVDSVLEGSRKRSRDKGRSEEEAEITALTAARIATNLVADHIAALHPDVETPFQDTIDVVKRLLPYHVFQQPKDDLHTIANSGNKGKRRATEEELLRDEIEETKFAIECWKRRAALENRFKKARANAGKRASPDDQLYILTQSVLEADRIETANMNGELRAVRQELEKVEREKKAAATPQHPQYYPPPAAATPPAYSTPYRGYTYTYGQGYNAQYTYSPYVPPNTTPPTYSAAPYSTAPSATLRAPAFPPPASVPTPSPSPASTSAPSPVTPAPTPQTQSSLSAPATVVAPIPVQLPVSSLAALSALGIVPVPATGAPPAGQSLPACILKGTAQNGSMICLEINVSSLQANQLSGLAIILSALTSRGVNVDASKSPNPSGAASGSTGSAGTSGTDTSSAAVGVSSSRR